MALNIIVMQMTSRNILSFAPAIEGDKEICLTKLQNSIQDIRLWLRTNLLKLNDSKMEFIMVESK